MNNSQKTIYSLPKGMIQLEVEAESFFKSLMDHYNNGTIEHRIHRTSEFLDELIFNLKYDLVNPFSNDSRKYYQLAVFTKDILIPQVIEALEIEENSNPFEIHNWN